MKTIGRYVRPYTLIIAFTMLLKLAAAVLDLLIPSFLARIIDDAVPAGSRSGIFFWGGVMLVCAVLSMFTNMYANRIAARTSGQMTRTLRHDLFSKLSYLSGAQLDRISIPSAVSRLTTDTYNLNRFFNRIQRMGVRAPILLVGGIAITLLMDPVLTLVLLATLPFIGLLVYHVTSRSVPLYTRQQGVLDRLVRTVQENITGVRVIKALSRVSHEKDRFEQVNQDLSGIEEKAGSVMALSNPAASFILNIGLVLVVVTGAYLVNAGRSTTGNIIAFLNYFTIILNAMLGITRVFVMYSKGKASALRVEEVLLMPEDLPLLEAGAHEPSPYHIQWKDVSFSYNKRRDNLSHISFALMRGQTLGVIGATGSGKSTLVALMLRLYEADSGRILIDGQDIRAIPRETLYGKMGIAFQNDFIMADTLKENIRYFRDIPDEDIRRAVEDAQARDIVREKEQGLLHRAAVRGQDLSGGQKQRLLIARALAGTPEILILDDASSALDYQTDAKLRGALARNYTEATKIIIAQRVSAIMGADHILVMDEGRVQSAGTHEELMKTSDVYREIADTQMSLLEGAPLV
ncbi:MAG: ABC transporter ATP-binding protein [Eubacteriales bacterium]|nr:ABC transporter ATP-binding protein [Eubacteriales bacterium]